MGIDLYARRERLYYSYRMSNKGPRANFRPKEPPATSVILTALGKGLLRAAAKRTQQSASDVVEELLRRHATELEYMARVDDADAA